MTTQPQPDPVPESPEDRRRRMAAEDAASRALPSAGDGAGASVWTRADEWEAAGMAWGVLWPDSADRRDLKLRPYPVEIMEYGDEVLRVECLGVTWQYEMFALFAPPSVTPPPGWERELAALAAEREAGT